jgi:DNA-binding transcriptional regulator YiaG
MNAMSGSRPRNCATQGPLYLAFECFANCSARCFRRAFFRRASDRPLHFRGAAMVTRNSCGTVRHSLKSFHFSHLRDSPTQCPFFSTSPVTAITKAFLFAQTIRLQFHYQGVHISMRKLKRKSSPRSTDARIDGYIGDRMRERRLALQMSQGELGSRLGVSYQQVQKYEAGANRVSAGRLFDICEVLQMPLASMCERTLKAG